MQNKKQNKNKNNRNRSLRLGRTIPNQIYSLSFPREFLVKMKYHHLGSFSTTASIANDRVFNLNSIWDPDRTGVGHQPQSRDQWASLYNRYRVDKVKVTLRGTTDSTHGMVYGMIPTNNASGINDTDQFGEANRSISAIGTLATPVFLQKTYDLAVINGVPHSTYRADDRFQSLFTTSPSEVICLHVCSYEVALGSVAANYDLVIEYWCTLSDPIQIASS